PDHRYGGAPPPQPYPCGEDSRHLDPHASQQAAAVRRGRRPRAAALRVVRLTVPDRSRGSAMSDQPATSVLPAFSSAALRRMTKRGDIGLALGIIGILVVLILPMPTWLLDVCLAISITFYVLILMTVLFIERPLDFSAFPTVILIATMLRLALNLASTR